MKDIITLAVESSCDETSVAVLKNGREVLSNIINTQVDLHKKFGGVVPEIAPRNHIEAISNVVKEAIKQANITMNDIDVIACTYGPGLVGALLGVSFLSHLSGDEVADTYKTHFLLFLSHLSGDEASAWFFQRCAVFLSHLSGDEVSMRYQTVLPDFLSHLSGDEVTAQVT